jgi:hypothetical protein
MFDKLYNQFCSDGQIVVKNYMLDERNHILLFGEKERFLDIANDMNEKILAFFKENGQEIEVTVDEYYITKQKAKGYKYHNIIYFPKVGMSTDMGYRGIPCIAKDNKIFAPYEYEMIRAGTIYKED